MEGDRYTVLRIKDVEPEVFWIAFKREGLPRGSFMRTSGDLTENGLRAALKKMGRTKLEIDGLIQRARENPA